ncbi:MAG: sugar nucleotide-binding protein [Acholeplasmataceae bacterium]|nr:sugar nucleotide-binding protein [Acholeplasmataceae bacterium]
MKAIFTGLNGTVAPEVAKLFKTKGVEVVQYDRNVIPVDNEFEIEGFLKLHKPNLFLHFATGTPEWAGILAKLAKKLGIRFVYISTVSVYSGKSKGPIILSTVPDAEDNYGKYKRTSEEIVLKHNPDSYILRLGWQIGVNPGSNHMIDYLYKEMDKNKVIKASSKWYPSCSFMEDTALGIFDAVSNHPSGTYLINSNDSFSFYQIVSYLAKLHPILKVEERNDFIQDIRMVDARIKITKLSERFRLL